MTPLSDVYAVVAVFLVAGSLLGAFVAALRY